MKHLRLIVSAPALLAVVVYVAWLQPRYLTCQASYRKDRTVLIDSQTLGVEVAKTSAEKIRGLGGRECLGAGQAMLFEFVAPAHYPIWMREMRFAIDIVWLDSNHKVVHIESDISPSTYPRTFSNPVSAQYVLELKAGQAERLGLANGQVVQF
jgi:hypothetical protein